MGNKGSGIIFNQSDKQILYTLHHFSLQKTQALVIKAAGANVQADLLTLSPSAGVNANYSQEVKKQAKQIDCVYRLNPKSITRVGLADIDFNKIKFMTVITADNEKIIMKSGNVNNYKSLMIKIRPDYSMKAIEESEAQHLEKIDKGQPIKQGACSVCKENSKSTLTEFTKDSLTCRGCDKEFKEIWICMLYPSKHCFCPGCFLGKSFVKHIDSM